MTDFRQGEVPAGRYLADRFQWAAPGDQQEDAWLVRFCDRDCGDAIFTGPDAEAEAWAYWERYAPSFNIYVFRLAALRQPGAEYRRGVEDAARVAEGRTGTRKRGQSLATAIRALTDATPPV